MAEQRPMIVTDGELMLAVIWHGGSMFRVHTCDTTGGHTCDTFCDHVCDMEPNNGRTILGVSLNAVDVFTYYGNENGDPPDVMQAYAKMQDWLDEQQGE